MGQSQLATSIRDTTAEADRLHRGLPVASWDGNVYLTADVHVTAAEMYAACENGHSVVMRGYRIFIEDACDFSRIRIG